MILSFLMMIIDNSFGPTLLFIDIFLFCFLLFRPEVLSCCCGDAVGVECRQGLFVTPDFGINKLAVIFCSYFSVVADV